MKIFILAGGFGTRLQSVVSSVPKPMAPVNSKPFLLYQIEEIKHYFPNEKIYLLTYYLSEVIENYFENDESIIILKEEKPLGTGGSIKNAIDTLSLGLKEDIIVLNGDTYIKPNLSKMIMNITHKISILGSLQTNCDRFGVLSTHGSHITHFEEKKIGVRNSYINAGCYYFKELDFFEKIEEKVFSIENEFQKYLLHSKINIFRYNDIFIDIGLPEDYEKMNNYASENENK